ncbi:MAG: hypothetical protein IPM48_15000 [Saprospiraceae bacterium]|nr:hypothetical protein [Saprospiraceae bacterium]
MAAKKKTTKKTEIKKEEVKVKEAPRTVEIHSADGRTLYAHVAGKKYEGKVIEVSSERESDVRRVLIEGGFLLK